MASKLTKAARGQDCTLRIYPYCNFNEETTVLAHINSKDKGWSMKSKDHFGVFACSTCHDIIDGRKPVDLTAEEIQKSILSGLCLTWEKWIEMGLIKVG